MLQDLRYGLRLVRSYKGFSLTVVVVLGLGIGANTAIFSVVDAALLQRLPFAEAHRLVVLNGVMDRPSGPQPRGMSYPDFEDWRAENRTFETIAAVSSIAVNLAGDPISERLTGEIVSQEYFATLRVDPALGRTFTPDEDQRPDEHPVAVLGHGLWKRRFGGSADVLGRELELDGRRFTVLGVMPEGFAGLSLDAEIWLPMAMISLVRPARGLEERDYRWIYAVGRLRDGVTTPQAQEDLDSISLAQQEAYPETNTDRRALLEGLRQAYLGDLQLTLLVLLAAVGSLLLIACANVTNLLLARSASRSGEVALRLALGAGRRRLFRQLLTESLVLSLAGGAAGMLVALWSVEGLRAAMPPGLLPGYVTMAVDSRVFLFTAAVTVFAGVLSGLAPAMRASRFQLAPELRGVAHALASASESRGAFGLQGFLVSCQVAVTVGLLVCAGVMARSLWKQLEMDPGFDPAGLTAFRLTLPLETYRHPERLRFVRDLEREVRSRVPRVEGLAIASDLPFRGLSTAGLLWRDEELSGQESGFRYYRHSVSPAFFDIMGVAIVQGRRFDDGDVMSSTPVAIIGAAAARRLWPDARTIVGRRLRLDPEGRPLTVVGVVDDLRYRSLQEDLTGSETDPEIYFPLAQSSRAVLELVVRVDTDAGLLAGRVSEAVRAVDPDVPIDAIAAMTTALRAQTAMSRFQSTLLLAFGLVGLALGAAGVYGLLAYAVARRNREIAVRLAMGAGPEDIVGIFMRRGMLLTVPGLVVGIVLGVQGAQAMRSLLFGVSAADPLTLGVAGGVVLVAAVGASILPARRGGRVDPMATLRAE